MKCAGLLVLLVAATAYALPPSTFFVANEGQWEGAFAFRCDLGASTYFVTSMGMTIDLREKSQSENPKSQNRDPRSDPLHPPTEVGGDQTVRGHALRLNFLNANPNPEIIGEEKLSSYSNYFLGRDSCQWRSRVGNYGKVIARDVWPGIDVEYRPQAEGVETVYRVKPGADPTRIIVQYEGLDAPLSVGADGRLHLQTSLGVVYEQAPFAYQIVNGEQARVETSYRILSGSTYTILFGSFDAMRELVIDPQLVYSTYFARSWDVVNDVITDSLGYPIIAGGTADRNFPTTPGSYRDTSPHGDGFITKLTPDGDSLVFSTFFGGGGASSKVLLTGGSVYYQAYVQQGGWPMTPDAFDTVSRPPDIGISLLSADGSMLEFGSYLGGAGWDYATDCQVDSLGKVYICGGTRSSDFPVTPDALYSSNAILGTGFLTMFDPTSRSITYSTFYTSDVGTELGSLHVVAPGDVWMVGIGSPCGLPTTTGALQTECRSEYSNYFMHLDFNQDTIVYASYFGGRNSTSDDILGEAFPGDSGRVWLFGSGDSADVPMPGGGFDSTRPNGETDITIRELQLPATINRGTYLGHTGFEAISSIHRDANGYFVISGWVVGDGLPTTPDAFCSYYHGGLEGDEAGDLFVARMSADLTTLEYSTYIGGTWRDDVYGATLTQEGALWLTGKTFSGDFPTTQGAMFPNPAGSYLLRMDMFTTDVPCKPSITAPVDVTLSSYPNPFNPATMLTFTLPHASSVKLEVFDILGRQVYDADLGKMSAGSHQHRIDGSQWASGVYFARVEAGAARVVRKMLLLR
jgi:hypothetical protein